MRLKCKKIELFHLFGNFLISYAHAEQVYCAKLNQEFDLNKWVNENVNVLKDRFYGNDIRDNGLKFLKDVMDEEFNLCKLKMCNYRLILKDLRS